MKRPSFTFNCVTKASYHLFYMDFVEADFSGSVSSCFESETKKVDHFIMIDFPFNLDSIRCNLLLKINSYNLENHSTFKKEKSIKADDSAD